MHLTIWILYLVSSAFAVFFWSFMFGTFPFFYFDLTCKISCFSTGKCVNKKEKNTLIHKKNVFKLNKLFRVSYKVSVFFKWNWRIKFSHPNCLVLCSNRNLRSRRQLDAVSRDRFKEQLRVGCSRDKIVSRTIRDCLTKLPEEIDGIETKMISWGFSRAGY